MDVVVYHNGDCGTSRNVLALLHAAGVEPHVVEYLKSPPNRTLLAALIARSGMGVRDVIRGKGTPFAELGLGDPSLGDDALLDAMVAHPILINRPIVVAPKGVRLCRPSDIVLDLLDDLPSGDILKEEGVPFLIDRRIGGDDPALLAALGKAGLPAEDAMEPGRRFFAYRTLAGEAVGFGGYEPYGADMLLRSVVVLAEWRARGIGANLVPLLLRRAFDEGARRAWLLTATVAGFFEGLRFRPAARETAPAAILATRQATELCPTSAMLLSRSLRL